MDDRKLLEAAARAAGITIDPIDALHEPDEWACWNPLTDDGDALRLAVKLNFLHHYKPQFESAMTQEILASTDDYAATRRAIVRAAAALAGHQEEVKR